MANYVLETEAEVRMDVDLFMEDLARCFGETDLLIVMGRFLDSRDSLNFAERLARTVDEWIEEYKGN